MFNPKHPPQNLDEIRAMLAELPAADREAQDAVL